MRNFIQPGKTLTLLALAAVASGCFIKQGSIFGVAATSADEGEEFELNTGGVYELPKVVDDELSVGDDVYATEDGIMTKDTTNTTKVGVAVTPALNSAGFVRVRLNDNF